MNNLMRARVRSFSKDEKGATMFEYAILVGVIALVAIGGATVFGTDLHDLFTKQGTSVSTTNSTAKTQ
jgi:pilus assembly protein Flp/PilA